MKGICSSCVRMGIIENGRLVGEQEEYMTWKYVHMHNGSAKVWDSAVICCPACSCYMTWDSSDWHRIHRKRHCFPRLVWSLWCFTGFLKKLNIMYDGVFQACFNGIVTRPWFDGRLGSSVGNVKFFSFLLSPLPIIHAPYLIQFSTISKGTHGGYFHFGCLC